MSHQILHPSFRRIQSEAQVFTMFNIHALSHMPSSPEPREASLYCLYHITDKILKYFTFCKYEYLLIHTKIRQDKCSPHKCIARKSSTVTG